MKTFCIFLIISLFTSAVFGQDGNFSIKGTIKNARKGSVAYLRYTNSKGLILDTSAVLNGTFQFSGSIDEPRPAVLTVQLPNSPPDPQSTLSIYIEPGEMEISGRGNFAYANVKGGPTTDESNELNKLLGADKATNNVPIPISTRVVAVPAGTRPVQIPGSGGRPIAAGSETRDMKDAQDADQIRKTIKFIKANPTSFVSLYSLQSLWSSHKIDIKQLESLLAGLSPSLLESKMGRLFFKK